MYFLIYISSASALFTDNELEDILTISRRNNEQSGITGVLLYHDGTVLQVLEGDQLAVTNRYHCILLDERHRGVLKIMEGENDVRYFPEWRMGFRNLNAAQWSTVSGYFPINSTSSQFESQSGTSQEMVTFIQSFCKTNFRL